MDTKENAINRDLIVGWSVIVLILFAAYTGEVMKGVRSGGYLFVFMIFTGLPAAVNVWLYRKNPNSARLRYFIIIGYFLMYGFVMVTGSTALVFTYILPMLSLIVLYRQEKIILGMGITALLMNLIFIGLRVLRNEISKGNSKEIEIQLALLFLCFGGSYVAAKLYGEITRKNQEYLQILDEKSKQIQTMTFQSILTIANTIDAKDKYTNGHSQRVSEYSYKLAGKLGLSEEEASHIRNIALLHDIGKIGVPDSILNKPGKLTDEEYEIMKQHSTVGAEILKDIRILPDLDIGAKYHHERYDGKGYPSGLKGEDIPKVARIICVADTYDAMSSNRVYRKSLSDEQILLELKRCSGTQFDPEMAEKFIEMLETKEIVRLSDDYRQDKVNLQQQPLHELLENPQNKKDVLETLSDKKKLEQTEKRTKQLLAKEHGCMILIDVDNIGIINRRFGYLKGDFCLGVLANALIRADRKMLVSRIAGDEFQCYVPSVHTVAEAEIKMKNLLKLLNNEIQEIGGMERCTLSAGVALSCVSGRDYSRLRIDADKALSQVKQQGKNGFLIYDEAKRESDSYLSKKDLDNLVRLIEKEYKYKGALTVDYHEFTRLYDFIREIGRRNAQNVQLLLFTLRPEDEKHFEIAEREKAMGYVEKAIAQTVRTVDVTTRYSSNQQLAVFMNLDEEQIHVVTDRILTEFYRMYDKRNVVLSYDVANLDFEQDGE